MFPFMRIMKKKNEGLFCSCFLAVLVLCPSASLANYEKLYSQVVNQQVRQLLVMEGHHSWIIWNEIRKVRENNAQAGAADGQQQNLLAALEIEECAGDSMNAPGFLVCTEILDKQNKDEESYPYLRLYNGILETIAKPGRRKQGEHPGHRYFVYLVQKHLKHHHVEMVEGLTKRGWGTQYFQQEPFADSQLANANQTFGWSLEKDLMLLESIKTAFEKFGFWDLPVYRRITPTLSAKNMLNHQFRGSINEKVTFRDENTEMLALLRNDGCGGYLAVFIGIKRVIPWKHIAIGILQQFPDNEQAIKLGEFVGLTSDEIISTDLSVCIAKEKGLHPYLRNLCEKAEVSFEHRDSLKIAVERGLSDFSDKSDIGTVMVALKIWRVLSQYESQTIGGKSTSVDKKQALLATLANKDVGGYLGLLDKMVRLKRYTEVGKVLAALPDPDMSDRIATAVNLPGPYHLWNKDKQPRSTDAASLAQQLSSMSVSSSVSSTSTASTGAAGGDVSTEEYINVQTGKSDTISLGFIKKNPDGSPMLLQSPSAKSRK
ncbi:hypothetical protein M3P05_17500 [Sansalvadorimonas sp. 2012CJ34-2]|uniref:Uncharacterized protein n=1 Tax=Parendozoicomonas callyspongiae TaxID=2942213 RepID=A0ABT0PLW2_9GAMM|nr:hypothetical protein [Sansalvadorimonas sp. 2012CJ34-2]MCL6271717.1 hypothetical protein [Sansalvadorimonas sp. 2012CJ34-2]